MTDSDTSFRRIKVVRIIDEYGLDGIGGELEQRWTAENDERMSLRDLAAYFNQQLLEQTMDDAGLQPLSGEVENIYRLLTGDDVSGADKIRTRRRLEREGIAVEELERDFVTYQAIRTYLKDHRGAEHTTDDRPRIDIEAENMQRIRGRTISITQGKIEQLEKGNHLSIGDVRIFVDINVLCEDCGAQFAIDELLERGGCECDRESEMNK